MTWPLGYMTSDEHRAWRGRHMESARPFLGVLRTRAPLPRFIVAESLAEALSEGRRSVRDDLEIGTELHLCAVYERTVAWWPDRQRGSSFVSEARYLLRDEEIGGLPDAVARDLVPVVWRSDGSVSPAVKGIERRFAQLLSREDRRKQRRPSKGGRSAA